MKELRGDVVVTCRACECVFAVSDATGEGSEAQFARTVREVLDHDCICRRCGRPAERREDPRDADEVEIYVKDDPSQTDLKVRFVKWGPRGRVTGPLAWKLGFSITRDQARIIRDQLIVALAAPDAS